MLLGVLVYIILYYRLTVKQTVATPPTWRLVHRKASAHGLCMPAPCYTHCTGCHVGGHSTVTVALEKCIKFISKRRGYLKVSPILSMKYIQPNSSAYSKSPDRKYMSPVTCISGLEICCTLMNLAGCTSWTGWETLLGNPSFLRWIWCTFLKQLWLWNVPQHGTLCSVYSKVLAYITHVPTPSYAQGAKSEELPLSVWLLVYSTKWCKLKLREAINVLWYNQKYIQLMMIQLINRRFSYFTVSPW